MRKIELCGHCLRYSRCLSYFLSSLDINPVPSAKIVVTVFWWPGDRKTFDVIAYFHERWKNRTRFIDLRPWALSLPKLCRRAIGRNLSTSKTEADLWWAIDIDYVMGPNCLETLATMDLPDSKLYYPRELMISKTHALGDAASLKAAAGPGIYRINPGDYRPSKHRAIGGLQIVPGNVAREYGYCRDTKWQNPVKDGKWQDTRGDKAFRGILGTKGTPIHLPHLYRIRQSVEGVVDTLESS